MGKKRSAAIDYELIEHTADFGVRFFGKDAAALFRNGASVLMDLITEPGRIRGGHAQQLRISGADWPDLMVNWLRELLYLWNGEGKLVASAQIKSICETELVSVVDYEAYSPRRHILKHEIKAVTYHQINVLETGSGWEAQVIFDV